MPLADWALSVKLISFGITIDHDGDKHDMLKVGRSLWNISMSRASLKAINDHYLHR